MESNLDPQKYYRLPWSLNDNGISWLEVTTRCNLACEGCYRNKQTEGHKSLKEIEEDLAVFKKHRKSDCMSIAGGDPLVHPQIVEITRMVKDGGWKPILNTNGLALTPERLRELKKAGIFGFTFHIDTSQVRKDCVATTEKDYNELRQKFAEMLAEVGGIACSFNQTVTKETLHQVPDVVTWAQKHPDIVHTIVFILIRLPHLMGDYDYYVRGQKIPLSETYEKTSWGGDQLIKTKDVVQKIRGVDPHFEPCSYLNGTVDPDSMKWTIAIRLATLQDSLGYLTPRFMELVQEGHHFLKKKWLSYSHPSFLKKGRLTLWAFSHLDKAIRRMALNYLKTSFRKPSKLLKQIYLQAFTIIQPIDMMSDGQMNMCDGCPDMTVYNGKLYWSCRLEEIKEYGCFVTASPRNVEQIK